VSRLCAFLVVGVVTAKAQSKSAEPRVVRYHTTMADVKYVYGVASPVARLLPGHPGNEHRGRFRQRHSEVRRHSEFGEGTIPHRTLLHEGADPATRW